MKSQVFTNIKLVINILLIIVMGTTWAFSQDICCIDGDDTLTADVQCMGMSCAECNNEVHHIPSQIVQSKYSNLAIGNVVVSCECLKLQAIITEISNTEITAIAISLFLQTGNSSRIIPQKAFHVVFTPERFVPSRLLFRETTVILI